jgi:hypothetical protein
MNCCNFCISTPSRPAIVSVDIPSTGIENPCMWARLLRAAAAFLFGDQRFQQLRKLIQTALPNFLVPIHEPPRGTKSQHQALTEQDNPERHFGPVSNDEGVVAKFVTDRRQWTMARGENSGGRQHL